MQGASAKKVVFDPRRSLVSWRATKCGSWLSVHRGLASGVHDDHE